eukprot:CAMPEP_0113303608 /NCGR_PEP_ID=MMETSP0010_2-20120614/3954_1 /TAXON_ID=216773 ORGANISM="Corethron hystrix, Strain 308" /NCGR_SAMPLE_ID=MMETSP0010_2 /ASSEMBLY_ACC=CAM_ASM_000155 /LENGTH=588 /DNA_ID=CAMNT_0000157635 /DNA_START=398 /DNA_END=2164 /DNA_ORIENTATION=+ /assembly_acc=CAM_ASM_000155
MDDMMRRENSRLYDDLTVTGVAEPKSLAGKGGSGLNFLKKLGNSGKDRESAAEPAKQYLRIERLNDRLESYRYSMSAATSGRAGASARFRRDGWERVASKVISAAEDEEGEPLHPEVRKDLIEAEEKYVRKAGALWNIAAELSASLRAMAVEEVLVEFENSAAAGNETGSWMDGLPFSSESKAKKMSQKGEKQLISQLTAVQKDLANVELDFWGDAAEALGIERARALRVAVGRSAKVGLPAIAGAPWDAVVAANNATAIASASRPLSSLLDHDEPKKNTYVVDFPGDLTASQTFFLREEVTAILNACQEGDEVVMVLQSGGGTVTGYGLAAAQLQRIKEANIKLTVAVEQVAASGGYMMCCVADHIVASPFAVLGSIGVITDIPNVYERLKKEGVEFTTVTAGKFKRTLTPTKQITKEDIGKTKEDIEDIFRLFKEYVGTNRPGLDIDSVATGETWSGTDALEKGLCDEILTKDELLLRYVREGRDVYSVQYEDPEMAPSLQSLLPQSSVRGQRRRSASSVRGGIGSMFSEILRDAAKGALEDMIGGEYDMPNIERRNMAVGRVPYDSYRVEDPNYMARRVRFEADE